MSKLASTRITHEYSRQTLFNILQSIDVQVNSLSEGHISASYNAATAAPTTGTHAAGDFIRNSAPSELGGAGSKFVVLGFLCTVAGTPGTWLSCRVLTGN
jgi:hypothetical protein